MSNIITSFPLFILLYFYPSASLVSPDNEISPDESAYITTIELDNRETKTIRGYLSEGRPLDVTWANNMTNVKCFPKKENKNYTGHQVLYTLVMPAYSSLELSAVSNKDISMYAYQIQEGDKRNLPPSVSKVIYCESSSHKGNGSKDPEYIYLSSQSRANKVIIGVAGGEKETQGAFELEMKMKPKRR